MNIRDLTYLVAVARLKHFGKAAEFSHVSQPTLSTQLKKLEEELDVQIFERNSKNVLLTEAGAAIIQQAQIILNEVDHLKNMAKVLRDPFAGKIRLGIIPTIAPYLLPHIMPELTQRFHQCTIYLHEEKTEHLLEKLKNGTYDCVILALPVADEGCITASLYEETFYLTIPEKHPLSKQDTVSLKDLEEEPLLLLEEGHCFRDQALELCRHSRLKQRKDYYGTSFETLRHMVAAGIGLTLLPDLATQSTLPNHHLHFCKIKDSAASRSVAMLWRKNSPRSACYEAIAETITTVIKPLLCTSISSK